MMATESPARMPKAVSAAPAAVAAARSSPTRVVVTAVGALGVEEVAVVLADDFHDRVEGSRGEYHVVDGLDFGELVGDLERRLAQRD